MLDGQAARNGSEFFVAEHRGAGRIRGQARQFLRRQGPSVFRIFPSTTYVDSHFLSPFSFEWALLIAYFCGTLPHFLEPNNALEEGRRSAKR
jgi:hypothetical protein